MFRPLTTATETDSSGSQREAAEARAPASSAPIFAAVASSRIAAQSSTWLQVSTRVAPRLGTIPAREDQRSSDVLTATVVWIRADHQLRQFGARPCRSRVGAVGATASHSKAELVLNNQGSGPPARERMRTDAGREWRSRVQLVENPSFTIVFRPRHGIRTFSKPRTPAVS
jgi:hypothetical protein